MSFTIERHNNVVYFEVNKTLVTKLKGKGWVTLAGEKFDRNIINNLVNCKALTKRLHCVQLKSVLNRYFNGEYSFN